MVVTEAREALQQWEGRETVTLPEVARVIGMPRPTREFATRTGAIRPVSGGGKGRPYLLSWDEVVFILGAAVFAAAAGIAITVALRALRETGAQVSTSGITINLGSGS